MSNTPPASLFNTVDVMIDAPPARVWSLFLDRSRWMESFVSREPISGTPNTAGERARVVTTTAGASDRIEETLHIAPAQRQVVRITVDGMANFAHADFLLTPVGKGCHVRVSIHTIVAEAASPEALSQLLAGTQAKIGGDFRVLKQVAEAETL